MEKDVEKKPIGPTLKRMQVGGQGSVSGLEGIIRTLNYWSDTNRYGRAVFNPFGVP